MKHLHYSADTSLFTVYQNKTNIQYIQTMTEKIGIAMCPRTYYIYYVFYRRENVTFMMLFVKVITAHRQYLVIETLYQCRRFPDIHVDYFDSKPPNNNLPF